MTVGENIKRIRLQRGLTQAELGYLVGIAESAVRRYELNMLKPKYDRLEKIANCLGVNVEVLLNAEMNDIQAMHKLFQLFRQYDGRFTSFGQIQFTKLNTSAFHERWKIYQKEIEQAQSIKEPEAQREALEDAEDKFNWWMDTYPKSDHLGQDFDENLETYRALKNKRRKNSKNC